MSTFRRELGRVLGLVADGHPGSPRKQPYDIYHAGDHVGSLTHPLNVAAVAQNYGAQTVVVYRNHPIIDIAVSGSQVTESVIVRQSDEIDAIIAESFRAHRSKFQRRMT